MAIEITTRFAFELDRPTDVLLQFEAAALPDQSLETAQTRLPNMPHFSRVAAHDGIGERIWLHAQGRVEVEYDAAVAPLRNPANLTAIKGVEPHKLPSEAVQYLFDSRYCPADGFQTFVSSEFGGTDGGARVDAIRSWIAQKIDYVPGVSDPGTTAADSFIARQGICRDFAHVLVTLARASTIPARYVACYAPGVSPPDFHAVAEVFLDDPASENGGAWHLVDATGMADPAQTVKIGVGRDAADVSFLTSFGPNRFHFCSVDVRAA